MPLVGLTQQLVSCGVELGRETEGALKKIQDSAHKSTQMVKAIARATVEQARGSKEVTGSIQRIAATVELSTPPLMATAIGFSGMLFYTCAGVSGEILRRCATEAATASMSASTCCSSLARPSEKRILAFARAVSRPIAFNTWEGSTEPLEQAEPLETAKPRRSSAITRDSPSRQSK